MKDEHACHPAMTPGRPPMQTLDVSHRVFPVAVIRLRAHVSSSG